VGEAVAPLADDLVSLEGIGPKVAKLLEGAGITTFKALAKADPARVKEVLDAAGYKYMDPAGWIEQAKFAAAGDKEGLAKLQSELKGGRRA
jgi:predicted flap endonuclease-1-like 5' DNA nuclease